jgi:hypothetical protein
MKLSEAYILASNHIICESSPTLVAKKISDLVAKGDNIDTFLNRIADEAVNTPTNFPIGNGLTININKENNRAKYIDNIIDDLNIENTAIRNATIRKIRNLEEKFQNALNNVKNDNVARPTIKRKAEYKPPVFHGWGY